MYYSSFIVYFDVVVRLFWSHWKPLCEGDTSERRGTNPPSSNWCKRQDSQRWETHTDTHFDEIVGNFDSKLQNSETKTKQGRLSLHDWANAYSTCSQPLLCPLWCKEGKKITVLCLMFLQGAKKKKKSENVPVALIIGEYPEPANQTRTISRTGTLFNQLWDSWHFRCTDTLTQIWLLCEEGFSCLHVCACSRNCVCARVFVWCVQLVSPHPCT